MRTDVLKAQARTLAQRVGRLHPDWSNPERYFERRDELRRELLTLADQIGGKHG